MAALDADRSPALAAGGVRAGLAAEAAPKWAEGVAALVGLGGLVGVLPGGADG